MPLPKQVDVLLEGVAEVSGDYTLFGLFINPSTGEVGTYSSHGCDPGQILAFLQQTTQMMLDAAMNGELIGEQHGRTEGEATLQPQTAPYLVH